ncbi:uncharacterized protein LOC144095528 [Amblyomma americanum]
MANTHLFFAPQAFLSLATCCLLASQPVTLHEAGCLPDADATNRICHACAYIAEQSPVIVPDIRLFATTATPQQPEHFKALQPVTIFSGQGSSHCASMANTHLFFAPQAFLSLATCCLLASQPVTLHEAGCLPDADATDRICHVCAYIAEQSPVIVPDIRLFATTATPQQPEHFKALQPVTIFSGQGSSHCASTANTHLFFAPQVCNRHSLFVKKNDNRFLISLPCPRVICAVACDCFDSAYLLLCCGDVESNPGPNTRTASASTDPERDSQQMNEIMKLLKGIDKKTSELTTGQTKLSADVNTIKSSQAVLETKLLDVFNRSGLIESRCKTLETLELDVAATQDTVEQLTSRQYELQARIDDLEDRSRRNNLILRGIPDARETWEQTEKKIITAFSTSLGTDFDQAVIERAHRIGTFSHQKCRPVVIRFGSFKDRGRILACRAKLKTDNISVSEDFSPATRNARQQLTNFAKSLPQSPKFQLRYNKLYVNNKCYMYDSVTNNIELIKEFPTEVLEEDTPRSPSSNAQNTENAP